MLKKLSVAGKSLHLAAGDRARALFKLWFVNFEPVRAKMEGRRRASRPISPGPPRPPLRPLPPPAGKIRTGRDSGGVGGYKYESILSDAFLAEVRGLPQRNRASGGYRKIADSKEALAVREVLRSFPAAPGSESP